MSLFVWQVAVLEYSYFMTMNKSSFCSKMRNLSQKAPPQLKYKYKKIYIYRCERKRERRRSLHGQQALSPCLPIHWVLSEAEGAIKWLMEVSWVQDTVVDHAFPNPDADAANAEQHSPKEAMEAAFKPTLVEMVTYSCTLFWIERKTVKLL